MPDCNAYRVEADWQLPVLVAGIEWVSGLEERASRVENDLVKRTSPAEAAFISKRIAEDRVLRVARKARPEEEEEEEAEGEGSSDERSQEHEAEEVARLDPTGSGINHSTVVEAQEEGGVEEAERPEEEWLGMGP